MKPFRKHVVVAVDGGGARGVIPAKALQMVEDEFFKTTDAPPNNWYDVIDIAAGTSTGSIISTALMVGLSANDILNLYLENIGEIFTKEHPIIPDLLTKHIYTNKYLKEVLTSYFGTKKLKDVWQDPVTGTYKCKDLIITVRDLTVPKTLFLKSWKDDADEWTLVDAVLASTAVPTQFPVVYGRYVDGGVGSFSNPTYVAVYEALKVRKWKPEDITVLSLGTGQEAIGIPVGEADHYHILDWIPLLISTFLSDANDQQVNIVKTWMGEGKLDFRRFQIKFNEGCPNPSATSDDDLAFLVKYGEGLGDMILNDKYDPNPDIPEYPGNECNGLT